MLPTVEAITARLLEIGDNLAWGTAMHGDTEETLEWISLRRQLKAMKEEV